MRNGWEGVEVVYSEFWCGTNLETGSGEKMSATRVGECRCEKSQVDIT